MKRKAILLSFIFVLSNTDGTLDAADDGQQAKTKQASTILTYMNVDPAVIRGQAHAVDQLLRQLLRPLLTQKKITPALLATTQKAARTMSKTDHAKEEIKKIALKLENPKASALEYGSNEETLFRLELGKAAAQAEIILNTYSYFNPYRYILSNKISLLRDLQLRAGEVKTEEKAQNYQEDVQKTLENLISWLG